MSLVVLSPDRGVSPAWGLVCTLGAALLGLVVIGGAAGCGGSAQSQAGAQAQAAAATDPGTAEAEEEDAIAVSTQALVREPMASLYATSATLRADKRATVTARTSGVIRRLLVEEGDNVDAGEPLAVLEDDEQKIEHQRAVTTRDTRAREYERAEQLHRQNLMSEEEYETARREAEESRHAAALTELILARTVIRSPFAGRIVTRHLDVGATVSDGIAVYDLADVHPLYADVQVPEREVPRLSPGQPVRVLAGPDSAGSEAEIERIAPAVDPATGTVKVTLAVPGATGLRPGSFVRVEIVTETHPDALVLPRSALVAEGRRWHIYRVTVEGDRVQQLEVARGFEEGDRVEILETLDGDRALEAGDEVVVVGASALSDGARIEVIEPESEEESEIVGGDDRVAT